MEIMSEGVFVIYEEDDILCYDFKIYRKANHCHEDNKANNEESNYDP